MLILSAEVLDTECPDHLYTRVAVLHEACVIDFASYDGRDGCLVIPMIVCDSASQMFLRSRSQGLLMRQVVSNKPRPLHSLCLHVQNIDIL
jgi:hypothetical protein